jgi:peptidylprolyl isomerase
MEDGMTRTTTVLLAAGLFLVGCAGNKPVAQLAPTPAAQAAVTPAPTAVPAAEAPLGTLKITDQALGTGSEAVSGKRVTVNYEGRLITGRKFDSSYDRGQPFSFVLGAGQVIAGWEQGILGMKVGGKRQLVIPPHLGYGATGAGGVIPPNATLVFDVELLGVD